MIATIARELRNGRLLCLYCERNLERERQSTEGAGVGDMRVGACDGRKQFRASNPPRHPSPRWIVVRCASNINKDGARFGVRVRSWRSYGKIEDCKQSTNFSSASITRHTHAKSMNQLFITLPIEIYDEKTENPGENRKKIVS